MRILITGGMGFIGLNTTMWFKQRGHKVMVFDNLSKPGSEKNLKYLNYGEFTKGDLRDHIGLISLISSFKPEVIFHLAAQTAVTTSVKDPALDFDSNAMGTFHLLEAVRRHCPKTKVIYSSTNKVYGARVGKGQSPCTEQDSLDFHSPYGCSKGCADQYVRDYRRIYGLNTTVLRQSCIYGPGQTGTEDQGWVAWFIKCALEKKDITIYGDGNQVRDILHIDDLMSFYDLVVNKELCGVYNIGGGVDNAISLNDLICHLKAKLGFKSSQIKFEDARPGDQEYYVSNINRPITAGWEPKIKLYDGINSFIDYLKENK